MVYPQGSSIRAVAASLPQHVAVYGAGGEALSISPSWPSLRGTLRLLA